MGLPLRITFKDRDYIYQIVNTKIIDQYTTEIDLLLNDEKVALVKDVRSSWIQKGGDFAIDPELAQALGRSVSLRLRM